MIKYGGFVPISQIINLSIVYFLVFSAFFLLWRHYRSNDSVYKNRSFVCFAVAIFAWRMPDFLRFASGLSEFGIGALPIWSDRLFVSIGFIYCSMIFLVVALGPSRRALTENR